MKFLAENALAFFAHCPPCEARGRGLQNFNVINLRQIAAGGPLGAWQRRENLFKQTCFLSFSCSLGGVLQKKIELVNFEILEYWHFEPLEVRNLFYKRTLELWFFGTLDCTSKNEVWNFELWKLQFMLFGSLKLRKFETLFFFWVWNIGSWELCKFEP